MVMPFPGQLKVPSGGVKGRIAYQVSICSGDPTKEGDWSLLTTTGKNHLVVYKLESNQVDFFRVVAIGAAGASPVSDYADPKAA